MYTPIFVFITFMKVNRKRAPFTNDKKKFEIFKKKRLIIFNSSINKLYLQLKRKNSLTEHENMWKTKKKLFEM